MSSEVAKTPAEPIGLRVIVGYKFAKAGLEILLGTLLLFFASAHVEELRALAANLRHHAAAAWSIALAEELVDAASGRKLVVAGLAAVFDGVLSAVEGWALVRRYRWGGWLVVVTTSSLVPFELIALARHLSPGRIVLLLVNAVIVLYLIRRETRSEPLPGPGDPI
jgi:uncharacterized membrane protein (DUF2068 family)